MGLKLKPYPKYKESGLPWLGKIPVHWGVRRGKTVFTKVDIRSQTGVEELLTVSASDGVVPRRNKQVTMFMAESYKGHKLCWPGDLVINSLWAWMQGLGFSRYHGIVSSAYGVYRLRPEFTRYWTYFDYLLRSKAYDWELRIRSKGIWLSRLQLTDAAFFDMPIVVPSADEAEYIYAFLYVLDRAIRQYIRTKRRLIRILNEQRQAIIHKAVTRGLDPGVRLKPSGIDWLGDVPEHWEIKRLKWLADFNPSKSEARDVLERNENVVFLPMERVSTEGRIDCTELRPVADVWQGYTFFRRHDVIIAKITPCFENGKGAYLGSLVMEFGFGSTEFIVLRSKQGVDAEYLYLLTSLETFRAMGAEAMTGAAGQQRVPVDFIRNFQVPVPPLGEQRAIVGKIRAELLRFEQAVNRTRREIDLIREYRTRLITDVVTGKLDVRGVQLPDLDEDVVEEDWGEDLVEEMEGNASEEVLGDASD